MPPGKGDAADLEANSRGEVLYTMEGCLGIPCPLAGDRCASPPALDPRSEFP